MTKSLLRFCIARDEDSARRYAESEVQVLGDDGAISEAEFYRRRAADYRVMLAALR